jgi:hypothetical protein
LLPGDDPVVVAFSAGSVREEWVCSSPSDAFGTRVSNADWTTGDAVGIYMLPTDVTDLTNNDVWTNRKHIVDISGNLNPDGDANALYYPLNKSGVRFMAYYPYASGATSTHKVTFDFTDQSNKTKKESKDFCFHRGTTSYTSGTPALGLKHKFCKILINLSKGAGTTSCSGITASLSGMPKTATVDLNNFSRLQADSITVSTDSVTIKAYTHLGSTDDAATVEAIVAPHSGTGKFAKRKFTFTTAAGEEKVYELSDTVTFVAGKVYTFALEMVAGGISTKVGDGMTNCYIVAPDAELTFPVSRAYTHDGSKFSTTLHTGGTYIDGFAADVVWADAAVINGTPSVSGSGNSATVTVKTNASVSGNAVVKIYKSSDTTKTPVWSYHIWVTDYTGAETYTNTYTYSSKQYEFIFMDRNLGATKAGLTVAARGLFYQWGRKDPFPATDAVSAGSWSKAATSNVNGTVENTIKNPGVFYTASSAPYDWHYASRNNELWGHSGSKTIYDPCPSGWRVPVNSNMLSDTSPWAGFTKDNGGTWNSGYSWGANAAYPVTGYRVYNGGGLLNVGNYGYYWIASPSSSTSYNATHLNFRNGSVIDNYTHLRANGCTVRCVKE